MRAWDRLIKQERRGAGWVPRFFIRFAGSDPYAHMSFFPSPPPPPPHGRGTYKKAHRHGTGARPF
jgi:hypothetical protein